MTVRQFVSLFVLLCCAIVASPASAQVKIAQLSDLHIGLSRAPEGTDNLRRAVQLVNQESVDAVVVTGDIAERDSARQEAREILKGLKAKVYYIPGNHDVHSDGPAEFRSMFGDDYYKIQVKNVTIYALDTQLLGNWDKFEQSMAPAPQNIQSEGDKMMSWLASQDSDNRGRGKGRDGNNVTMAMLHVPPVRDGGFPNDPKQYWTVPEPNSSRLISTLKKLGVRDVLAGHWHDGRVFKAEGITWHVAPSTSWSPFGSRLGFAIHTVTTKGDVNTEFVPIK